MTVKKATLKNKKFIPIEHAPAPKPPKFWKPTPSELARNKFLQESMPELVKEYGISIDR